MTFFASSTRGWMGRLVLGFSFEDGFSFEGKDGIYV